MYSKILVPLDGSSFSEAALEHASQLARGTGAEIILLEAVQDSLAAVPEARYRAPVRQVYGSALRGRRYLEEVARRLRGAGMRVRCDVLEGDPKDAILSFAHREDVDVIVMSTHAHAGITRKVMGCLAEKLAAATRRPILFVKRGLPAGREVAAAA